MDQKNFQSEIVQGINTLNQDQKVRFAWICAVRALPFLCGNGHFNFWKENERQKHLYAVFFALDVNAYFVGNDTGSEFESNYKNLVHPATNAANIASSTANYYYNTISGVVAANAAAAAGAAAQAVIYGHAACNAAIAAYAAASYNVDFKTTLLLDLKYINDYQWHKIVMSQNLYKVPWVNFQKALRAIGCTFWGKLYQSIFDTGFKLDQNALKRRMSVPIEIQEKGATAVAHYLEELEKGANRLNEARIIILGDKGAGKTCLARRLIDPNAPMTNDSESTAGVDTTLWKLKEEDINVHIWDFAGHVVTHAVHQFFLSERCLYVIVYDGRTEERNRLEYWLNHIKNFGGDSKAIILVNKRDKHSVEIPINFLKEQYLIQGFYTFSIRDDKKQLEIFRNEISGYIENNPSWNKLVLPANYFRVKEELESIFLKGEKDKCKEHISKKEFDKIAKNKEIGNIDELLSGLHALGVSLWYKDMEEFNMLILNPEWISHGVYKIINWVNEERKYSLTLQNFTKVFEEDANRYPQDKHIFFLNLMIKYELAYQTEKGKNLIIPHLLREDRPLTLPDFQIEESLMLRYKADQPLPPNTISRFIVRHNQEIKKSADASLVWRYGVVLDDGNGTVALVREEDRTISVSVKGVNKTKYISTLRETLNDIFNSYKSKKPELQYRIERFGQIPDEVETRNPLWLPDQKVFTHAKDNVPYYDDLLRQLIDLQKTVNIYNITAQTLISGQGNQFLDQSTHNTFNFQDCNLSLQGYLNGLSQLLTEEGKNTEATELANVAKFIEQTEQCKTKEEVKKKGLADRLKLLIDKLSDENSSLHKTIKGLEYGVEKAQEIAEGYNKIAQWLGLPQVPKPFLKKE